jgi:malonyl CoA-acyl carrier protein transacylase
MPSVEAVGPASPETACHQIPATSGTAVVRRRHAAIARWMLLGLSLGTLAVLVGRVVGRPVGLVVVAALIICLATCVSVARADSRAARETYRAVDRLAADRGRR